MNVAIVHDWLTGMRGGEKCLEVFCELFPQATLFTLLHNKGSVSPTIEAMRIKTSFIQKFPNAVSGYRNYLPFFPRAIESFDFTGFDFILSSSHCVAKGARKPKSSFHLCYCHTPMRYAWSFFDQYFGDYPFPKKQFVRAVTGRLKAWDLRTLDRVDTFVANSRTTQSRIKDIYQRDATVINPPVDVARFKPASSGAREDFYLCVTALAPYKKVDVLVDAFNRVADKKLYIVGDGQLRADLEQRKTSANIKFLGWVSDEALTALYQRAKAFVFAAEEDFGISPIEAQAAGLPVIAFGKGGVRETVVGLNETANLAATGIFFMEQTPESVISALEQFEKNAQAFSSAGIRAHALQFSRPAFKDAMKRFIAEKIELS